MENIEILLEDKKKIEYGIRLVDLPLLIALLNNDFDYEIIQ